MAVSTNQRGSMEFAPSNEIFRHFQALSNQLSTPRILVCPSDKRVPATNWFTLRNANISYFLGMDSHASKPELLLSGDRNLMVDGVPVKPGRLDLTSNLELGWTPELHGGPGNVVLGDGSVLQLMPQRIQERNRTAGATNRLIIP